MMRAIWEEAGRYPQQRAERLGNRGTAHTGSGFARLLHNIRDVINPLQHLPFLSGLYRCLTGDHISPGAKLLGDALYGGPVGAVIGAAEAVADQVAGKDLAALAWRRLLDRKVTKVPPDVAVTETDHHVSPNTARALSVHAARQG